MLTFFRTNSKDNFIISYLSFVKRKIKQPPKKNTKPLSKNLMPAKIKLRVTK